MSNLQSLTIVTINAAVLFGMVLALLGSLKLALARRLNIGEGRIGGLISALNLALIPMMLFCGVILDLVGIRITLLVGSLFTAIALFSIGLAPTYRRALIATFIAGLGAAALCSAALVLMPHAFFDLGKNLSPALNLGHVFIALGALITPTLVEVMLNYISFRRTMTLLGMVALVPGILCLVPPFSDALAGLTLAGQRTFPLLNSPHIGDLALACIVFFFYAPLEAAIAVWTTTYLTEHGKSESEAAYLLSGFWAMFMLARLLVAVVRPVDGWDPWLIVFCAIGTAAMLGNLAGTASDGLSSFGVLALGFCLGPIFPTLIGVIFRDFPDARGTAHGVIFAVGSAAGLLLGPIMGIRLQKGSQSIFTIPLMLSLGLLLATVIFSVTVGRGG